MDRLLLDTTYLLPVFGVGVGLRRYEELFPRLLERYFVLYNPVSVVEAKWIVLRLCRREPRRRADLLEAYRRGLRALLGDERLHQTPLTSPEIEEIADRLLAEVRDYFDRIIYVTAAHGGAALATEDRELSSISRPEIPSPKGIVAWSDLAALLEEA